MPEEQVTILPDRKLVRVSNIHVSSPMSSKEIMERIKKNQQEGSTVDQ